MGRACATNMQKLLTIVLVPLVLLLALPTSQALEFVKADELAALMANEEQQVVLGLSSRGNCGEPCEMFNKFLTNDEENTLQNLYNISTIPAVQIYPYGHKSYDQAYAIDTNTTGQLMGAYLNAEKTQKAAYTKQVHDVFLQFLPKGEVENVNAGNLEEWLSQDSSKARALLVTAKSSTPPMFTKLALDYGAGMLFGELRSKQ